MSTSRRIVCLILLLPTAVFGTQFGQIPVTQVIGTPSITNDTNVTLTLGGTPTDAVLKPFSLTLGWTGQLSAARGGTGTTLGAEPPLGNPSTNGYVLSSTTGGVRSWIPPATGGGGGTVTSFSAGNLSPLFTTAVSNPTTTPALSFTAVSVAQGSWFGNASGVTAVPIFNNPGDLTKTDDTNVTLTLGGTPVSSLLKAVSITAGWTGTLAVSRGGTGAATSSANTWFGNSTASSAAPTFNSAGALTETDDTNVTLTLGGTPATSLLKAVSITAGWTGTLSQARGGFGKSTAGITDGQIPIGRTSDNSWQLATLTAGSNITITNGAGAITIASSGGAGGVTSLTQVAPIILTPNPIVGTGTIGLNVGVDHSFTAAQSVTVSDAVTTTITDVLSLRHNTSGAAGVGYGTSESFLGKSDTTNDRNLGKVEFAWKTATDASRSSYFQVEPANNGGFSGGSFRVYYSGFLTNDTQTDAGTPYINANSGYRVGGAVPTTGRILQSSGSAYVGSSFAFPSSAGTLNKVVKSDGTNLVMSTETYAAPGTSGNVMTSDGTNWTSAANAPGTVKSIVTTDVDQTGTAEQAHVTYTVPANSAAVGTTYRVFAWGNMDHGTTAITYTLNFRWGGVTGAQLPGAALTAVGDTTSRTNMKWRVEGYYTVRSTGASGFGRGQLTLAHHVNNTYSEDFRDSGGSTFNIDTTTNQDMVLTWTMDVNTGAPHVRTYGGGIEVIKP